MGTDLNSKGRVIRHRTTANWAITLLKRRWGRRGGGAAAARFMAPATSRASSSWSWGALDEIRDSSEGVAATALFIACSRRRVEGLATNIQSHIICNRVDAP